MKTTTRWALAALIAIGLSDPSPAQVIRGTNGDAAVLPSTVDIAVTPHGTGVYAAAILVDADGLLGVLGCTDGKGVIYEARADGSIARPLRAWSDTGTQVSDGIAMLICAAAAKRGLISINPPAQPPARRPVNPGAI